MASGVWIVTEDLGDGDVALRYFESEAIATAYMTQNEAWCYYESNPHYLNVAVPNDFKFNTLRD